MPKNIVEQVYRDAVERWRSHNIQTRTQLASALESYCVYFAYHSGRIENPEITYHETREVFENGQVLSYTGSVRTLFEIQNQKDCHKLILDAFAQRRPLSLEFALEVHETLTKGTYDELRWEKGERPGSFKMNDYVVGVGEVGAVVDDVPNAVANLIAQLHLATPDNILTVAAFFHASFESIHPFADGNGRVGRALMNYLLILNNHPPIIIYDEDKLAYYGALEQWDSVGDLESLKSFLQAETIKTWKTVNKQGSNPLVFRRRQKDPLVAGLVLLISGAPERIRRACFARAPSLGQDQASGEILKTCHGHVFLTDFPFSKVRILLSSVADRKTRSWRVSCC